MKKIFIIAGVAIFLVIIVLIIFACRSQEGEEGQTGPATLTYWRLFEDETVFEPIFESFNEKGSDIKIEYQKKNPEEYYSQLLSALAANQGPDIFIIRNDWLPAFKDKIEPVPENVFTPEEFEKIFVDIASKELISDDQIYGIPLSVNSLGLIYNEELLGEARCQRPPTNWNDFIDCTKKITRLSGTRISRSGAALGTTNNLDVTEADSKKLAHDILTAMMIQSGTEMVSADRSSASFGLPVEKSGGGTVYPGTRALSFYTSFAQPNKETYSWHSRMDNAISAFANQTTAMIFGYSETVKAIEAKNPKFSFYSAPFPQIKGSDDHKTTASYWIEVVSKHSKNKPQAWTFLKFLSQPIQISKYYSATKKPPSIKDMIDPTTGDPRYGGFSAQLNTAATWYKGEEPAKVYDIFANMINQVVAGKNAQNSIDAARNSVTNLLQKEKQ